MKCRSQCGACCIAPAIVEPFFGMPNGKPAGVRCVHLHPETMRCAIWNSDHYPQTCKDFTPDEAFCGTRREEAMQILTTLEKDTRP